MILDAPVKGKFVCLRSAQNEDARFVLDLRLDPDLNRFIGPTDPSVEVQQSWIAEKRAQTNDCHMIIEDFDGHPLGTIAIYDINPDDKRAEWGRWVIKKDAPFIVPFESAILMYYYAFYELKLVELYNGVQKDNHKAMNFHKGFGGDIMSSNDKETWFIFRKEHLKNVLNKYKEFHNLSLT